MATIRFRIDVTELKKVLSWDDLELIELVQEGERVPTYRMKRLAARFMVDETSSPLPYKQALSTLGALPLEEVTDVLKQFFTAMQEAAVPKVSESSSSLPSEVKPLSELPPGSLP